MALAFVAITFLHIVLGELGPTSPAISKPLRMTLRLIKPLRACSIIFRPAMFLMHKSSNLILQKLFRLQPAQGY